MSGEETLGRLTIFSGTWYPQEGGAEKQLRQVADELARIGWSVSVVAGDTGLTRIRRHPSGNPIVHLIRNPGGGGPRRLLLRPPFFYRSIRRGVASKPDLVVGSLLGTASTAAMLCSTIARCPLVLRLGGDTGSEMASSPVSRVGGRALVRASDAVVANAPHLLDHVQELHPSPRTVMRVVRNGVDLGDPVLVSAASSQARQGTLRVLFYTNGHPAKNERGFIELVTRMPTVNFRAVGRTQNLPDLANLERRGWVEDVAGEIGWTDVVLNTSSFEGSPNFCMQSLALGRPVVGYANPGLLDMKKTWADDVHTVDFDEVGQLSQLLLARDWRRFRVNAQPATIAEAAAEWSDLFVRLMRWSKNQDPGHLDS